MSNRSTYAQPENVYRQAFGGLVPVLPLGSGQTFKSDLRYSSSREDGAFRALDNQAFGSMCAYRLNAHAFGAGYQRMSGDDPLPFRQRSGREPPDRQLYPAALVA